MYGRPPSVFVTFLALLSLAGGCAARPVAEPAVPTRSVSEAPPSSSARAWFLRARIAESDGDLEEAERALKWLVREDGQRAVTHDHLASFYARARRWEDARRAWERSLSRDPDRWQPHAGLAVLDKRAGDEAGERAHLEAAVDRYADADTHERLLLVQEAAGELGAARATFARWHALPVDDPVLLMRRARAGRRLGEHGPALEDLIAVAQVPTRAPEMADLIAESAHKSCRLRTAWRWARQADVGPPRVRRAALDIAHAVGDAVLVERIVHGVAPDASTAVLHADRGFPVSIEAPDVLAAELWRRSERPERAAGLAALSPSPEARVAEALAALQMRDVDRARRALSGVPADHPTQGWARTLSLGLGDTDPGSLQAWIGAHPDQVDSVARAAAELHRLPGVDAERVQVRGLRLHGDAPSPDAVVRLPSEPSGALEAVLTRRAIDQALAEGRSAEARRLAETWTMRRPHQVEAWIARAEADSEQASAWLERALALEPCHPDAMLLSAHHAPTDEQVSWLRRAQEAAPLSTRVQQALTRRGLGAR